MTFYFEYRKLYAKVREDGVRFHVVARDPDEARALAVDHCKATGRSLGDTFGPNAKVDYTGILEAVGERG